MLGSNVGGVGDFILVGSGVGFGVDGLLVVGDDVFGAAISDGESVGSYDKEIEAATGLLVVGFVVPETGR